MGVATAMTFSGLNAPNYTPTNDSSNATTMYRDRRYMSPMPYFCPTSNFCSIIYNCSIMLKKFHLFTSIIMKKQF